MKSRNNNIDLREGASYGFETGFSQNNTDARKIMEQVAFF